MKFVIAIVLMLAATVHAQNDKIVADALQKVDQIEAAKAVIESENAKLWAMVRGDLEHDAGQDRQIQELTKQIETEIKKRKRAEEALHNRPAWIAMAFGGSMVALGVCSLVFGWQALAGSGVKLIGMGVIVTGIGYAAMIYWAWLVAIGFAAVIGAIAWILRDVYINHRAADSTVKAVEAAKIANLIPWDSKLKDFFSQIQAGTIAPKIVKAATK